MVIFNDDDWDEWRKNYNNFPFFTKPIEYYQKYFKKNGWELTLDETAQLIRRELYGYRFKEWRGINTLEGYILLPKNFIKECSFKGVKKCNGVKITPDETKEKFKILGYKGGKEIYQMEKVVVREGMYCNGYKNGHCNFLEKDSNCPLNQEEWDKLEVIDIDTFINRNEPRAFKDTNEMLDNWIMKYYEGDEE